MKKLILILIPFLLVSLLTAFEFEYDGEHRTRAALYNDAEDQAGEHIDSKLLLGLNANLIRDLTMRINLQLGDIVWGDADSGGGIAAAIPVKAYELYIDYRVEAISSNIRVGQQYWADHRSIMLDDSFSGVMFTADNFLSFKTELGWIKQVEGAANENKDDTNSFLISLSTEKPLPWGLQSFYTRNNEEKTGIVTLLPWLTADIKPLTLDLVGIYQYTDSDGNGDMDLGASARATVDLDPVEAGVDLLYYGNEDGELNYSISNYYQNELYIFGIGKHHDALCIYCGQSANADMYLGTVGFANVKLSEKVKAFAAVGLVADTGYEVNGGLEFGLIPETLLLSAYGAYGKLETNSFGNYLFGTTLKATF